MMFDFDSQKWVRWLLPAVLRQPRITAFVEALVEPIQTLYVLFSIYRTVQNDIAKTTGQVRILRNYLNRHFVSVDGLIDIVDDELLPPTYVYLEAENSPLYLPTFIAQSGGSDFVVLVPASLMSQENQIKAAVNQFKLPSKVFRIEYF